MLPLCDLCNYAANNCVLPHAQLNFPQIGTTPLHLAAKAGHVGVVQELIARGALVDVLTEVRRSLCRPSSDGLA